MVRLDLLGYWRGLRSDIDTLYSLVPATLGAGVVFDILLTPS